MEKSTRNTVVAVTRNGLGDMYLFDSFKDADTHPIIQYGDVICCRPEDVFRKYTRLEIPDLLRRLGDEALRTEILMKARSLTGWKGTMDRYSETVYQRMISQAQRPPEDPAKIVSIIVRDRRLSVGDRATRQENKRMNNAEDNTVETTATDTTSAAPKGRKPKAEKEASNEPQTYGGFRGDQKITLLVDKDGKPYGADNNPKRPGSKTYDRFVNYKNGMTVAEAMESGVQAGDLPYDVGKMYIKID